MVGYLTLSKYLQSTVQCRNAINYSTYGCCLQNPATITFLCVSNHHILSVNTKAENGVRRDEAE